MNKKKVWITSAVLMCGLSLGYFSIKHFKKDPSSKHKIVYSVSTPRALSTAFTRVWEAASDYDIYFEPSFTPYNFANGSLKEDKIQEGIPKTFEELKGHFFESLKTSNVFTKEIAFTVHHFLLTDQKFVKDPRVQFIFLIRNPHHSLISWHNLHERSGKFWIADWDRDCSLKDIHEIYQTVCKLSPNPPVIVFAEQIYADPDHTISNLFKQIDQPYDPSFLEWKASEDELNATSWHFLAELKRETKHNALTTSGFQAATQYEVNEKGEATFNEIENNVDRNNMMRTYRDQKEYYNLFLEETKQHLKTVPLPDRLN